MRAVIGVATALSAEARLFPCWHDSGHSSLRLHDDLTLTVTGMGREHALAGAARLLESGAQALVSFGFAAGLAPRLHAGALVAPRLVVAEDGAAFRSDERLRAALCGYASGETVTDGPVAETIRPLWDAQAKRALRARSDAIAADMESASLARAAAARGVPFAVLRAVVDPAERAIPACAQSALDASGNVRTGALLVALARRPWELAALIRLARDYAAACDTLRAAAAALCGRGRDSR
jgi:adenosylhomocysteine nucleosidase